MAKFCTKCGAPITEGVKFCPKCGAAIGQTQAAPQPTAPPQQPSVQQQQPAYQPQQPQQPYYGQTQPYASMPGKSNKKLIIGVVVAVIAIIIVLLVVFLLLGGADSRFVGEWEYDSGFGGKMNIKFNSDSTAELGYNGEYTSGKAKWHLEGEKICFEPADASDWDYYEDMCIKFKFSDSNNKLTLDWPGLGETTFTKK